MFLIPAVSLAQSGQGKSAFDTVKTVQVTKHALFTGTGYGSNFIYLGSTISGNQPYGYTSLTYGYNNNLYASVSAVHLSGLSPFLAFYTGTLNYSHIFNSWFDISASFSRYQVTSSLQNTLFNSFNYLDITPGFDWKILYTKISGGILFAGENNMYLQVRNSRYFETREYTRKKIYLSFDPYFNVLFGTLTKIETVEGQVVSVSPPYKKGGKYGQSKPVSTVFRSFGFIEADCGAPVSVNTGNFSLDLEPGYIIQASADPEYPGPEGFYFIISAFYRIF